MLQNINSTGAAPGGGARSVTAATPAWAQTAGQVVTGYASSVIGCDVEASVERTLNEDDTVDPLAGRLREELGCDAMTVNDNLILKTGRHPHPRSLPEDVLIFAKRYSIATLRPST